MICFSSFVLLEVGDLKSKVKQRNLDVEEKLVRSSAKPIRNRLTTCCENGESVVFLDV